MSSIGSGVARHFNRARRIPPHIGKDPSGRVIPFGPFTIYQPIVAVVIGWLVHITSDVWGSDQSTLFRVGAALLIGAAAGWATGFIDVTGRNPAILVYGIFRSLTLPVDGKGVPKLTRRRRHLQKTPAIMWAEPTDFEPDLEPEPVPERVATADADPAAKPVLASEPASSPPQIITIPPVNAARQSGLEAFLTSINH